MADMVEGGIVPRLGRDRDGAVAGDGATSASSASTLCLFDRRIGGVGTGRDEDSATSGLGSRRAFRFRWVGGG